MIIWDWLIKPIAITLPVWLWISFIWLVVVGGIIRVINTIIDLRKL